MNSLTPNHRSRGALLLAEFNKESTGDTNIVIGHRVLKLLFTPVPGFVLLYDVTRGTLDLSLSMNLSQIPSDLLSGTRYHSRLGKPSERSNHTETVGSWSVYAQNMPLEMVTPSQNSLRDRELQRFVQVCELVWVPTL